MKDLIKNILHIPVIEEEGPIFPPCVTLENYMTIPGMIGDGKAKKQTVYYQIDLWFRKRNELKRAIDMLHNCLAQQTDLSIPTIEISCNADHKLWRGTMKLEKIK